MNCIGVKRSSRVWLNRVMLLTAKMMMDSMGLLSMPSRSWWSSAREGVSSLS